MTWTTPTRSARRVARPQAQRRRYMTTIRWTDAELRTIQAAMPEGMTLCEYLRRCALPAPPEPLDHGV